MQESKLTPGPPDKQTVIARTLCMGSLIVRSILEWLIQAHSDPRDVKAYEEVACRFNSWLKLQDFAGLFTCTELQALSQPAGSWGLDQLDQQRFRGEVLATIYWGLSIYREIPPYVQPFESPNLGVLLGWPTDASANPRAKGLDKFPRIESAWLNQVARPRPESVIALQRKAAECWLWRINATALQRANVPPPEGQTWESMFATAAEEGFRSGAIEKPVENDFAIQGRPFRDLTDSELAVITMTAPARLLALTWLCGGPTEWDNT